MLWLPFVAGAQLFALLGKASLGWRADGFGPLYLYAINLGSAIYGYFALVLILATARRFVSEAVALSATLAVFLLGPLASYALLDGALSHATDAFAVALLVHHVAHPSAIAEREPQHWAIAGAFAGLCTLVRWQNLIFCALVGVLLATRAGKARSAPQRAQALRSLASFTATALLAFTPQMLVWQLQFGQPVYVPQGAQFFRAQPLLSATLFGPQNGLFSWSPIIALCTLVGLPLLALRARGLGLALLVGWAAQLYVNASVLDIGGGACCGARRFVGCSALFVLGLAAFYARAPRWLSALLTVGCALWTVPLSRACEIGSTFDAMLGADWPAVLDGVARAGAAHFRDPNRPWAQLWLLQHAGWLALPAALVVLGAWCSAIAGALALRLSSATSVRVCVTLSLANAALFAVAAARSAPAPAPAIVRGRDAMIDFGWYANSRFDHDPFLPVLEGVTNFQHLPAGTLSWRGVPLQIRPPVGGSNAAPSIASTCRPAPPRLSLALPPQPTRALHLALTALIWAPRGTPVARVILEHDDGSHSEQVLRAGEDVWNMIAAVPADRTVAWGGMGIVEGLRVPVDKPVRSWSIEALDQASACVSVFALTRERSDGSFEPIDIGAIANADYARDPFAPWPVLNHFPSLHPGELDTQGSAFRLLDPRVSDSGGTAISTAYHPYRQRIPLLARRTRELELLVDGALLPSREVPLVRATLEYDRGPDAHFELLSQRDVSNYDQPAAAPIAFAGPPPQDLTLRRWPLDPERVPRFLWLEGLPSADHDGTRAGIALFALTQKLADLGERAGPHDVNVAVNAQSAAQAPPRDHIPLGERAPLQ